MSRERAAEHFAAFLVELGLPMPADERQQTSERVTALLEHWSSAARAPSLPPVSIFAAPTSPDWVVLRELRFYSFCVHHMVPFFGTVDVAVLPSQSLIGFNALARLLDHLSRRPQLQEQLADALAQALQDALQPQGVLVRVTARQLCMEMRDHPNPIPCVCLSARGCCALGHAERDQALRLFS